MNYNSIINDDNMECIINSNLDKLRFIAEHDKNFYLTENTFNAGFKNAFMSIDLSRISNVRIKKTRSLVVNYILIFSILLAFLVVNSLFIFAPLLHFILNITTIICVFATVFVSKYSYILLINYKNLSFNDFNLPADKFNRLDCSFGG